MKHCILVKYKDEVTQAKKSILATEIKKVFAPLTEMEGIYYVEVITNVVDRPNRYDVLIRIDMDSDALDAYDHSDPHIIWKRDYSKYLESKAIFDYEDC